MTKFILLSLIGLSLTACNQNMGGDLQDDDQDTAILNGEVIKSRDEIGSRSVVGFETTEPNGEKRMGCTGTLIAKNAVLTAAHCMDPNYTAKSRIVNVVFETNYGSGRGNEVRKVTGMKPHPKYNTMYDPETGIKGKSLDNDIALVFFEGTIPSGYAIAALDTDLKADYSGKTSIFYGYGRSKEYSGSNNEPLNFSIGQLRMGELKISDKFTKEPFRYSSIENNPQTQNACQGDSGGPQFIVDGRGARVIGVTSSAGVSTTTGILCSYGKTTATRVAYFASWIEQQIKGKK